MAERRNVPTYLNENERDRIYRAAAQEGARVSDWIRSTCLARAAELERLRAEEAVPARRAPISSEALYEELVALGGTVSPSALVRRGGHEAEAIAEVLVRLEQAGRVRLRFTRIVAEVPVGLYVRGRGWIVAIEVEERDHAGDE